MKHDRPTDTELVAQICVAFLQNPNTKVPIGDVPTLISVTADAIRGLGEGPAREAKPQEHVPAVSVRKSLASPDHIYSLIDGKPYRTLTRHLGTHGLTPDTYRQRYGLKPDYPMTAPSYREARQAIAKKLGLGRKPNAATSKTTESKRPAPTRRKGIVEAKRAAKAHLGGSNE